MTIPRPHTVRKILRKYDICLADEIPIGLVLIYSAWIGEDEQALLRYTGLPTETLHPIIHNLIKNGVFAKNLNHIHDYLNGSNPSMLLSLDITCGMNVLQRSTKNGKPAWKMTKYGKEYVKHNVIPKLRAQEPTR